MCILMRNVDIYIYVLKSKIDVLLCPVEPE